MPSLMQPRARLPTIHTPVRLPRPSSCVFSYERMATHRMATMLTRFVRYHCSGSRLRHRCLASCGLATWTGA